MAIVKMKRLTLLALNSDKESIYDAIVRTRSVQLKRSADIESCTSIDESAEREKLLAKIQRVEEYVSYVSHATETYNAAHKRSKQDQIAMPKNSFARPKTEIDYDYLLNFGQNAVEIDCAIDNVARLKDRTAELNSLKLQKEAELSKLSLYEQLPHPTTWYRDTESATVQLSQLPSSELVALKSLADSFDAVECEVVDGSKNTVLVVVIAHKSQGEFFEKATALGLAKCSLVSDLLPKVVMEDIERQLNAIDVELKEISHEIASYADNIPQWKVYVDWLELSAKKLQADGDLQRTNSTFILEAFYPAEAEADVEKSLRSVSDDMVLTFDEIGDDEFAPTLTRNNKVVKQFEFVTNMYTPPHYHEVDPNPVMAVFYFVIFGLMMADIGYGLLLAIAGLFATFAIKQNTSIKNMLQLFGFCGISAIIVGALFGSFFSYQIYDGVIPSPADYPMVMMVLSLMLGVVHIMAGIGCKMAVKIKNNQKLSAWLADFPWIIVLATFLLAIFNMGVDMMAYEPYQALKLPDPIPTISLYVCLGALAVALVFAGIGAKGFFGKVIKSFGSAYGVINYFSDVMSYIRIFGLLLSSALVGSVVNQLSEMVIGDGGAGYIAAAVLLIFAHLFNLLMGIMSIYIHNGRLQYVEFFGKFYEGDGQLFVPFGSDTKYSLVK